MFDEGGGIYSQERRMTSISSDRPAAILLKLVSSEDSLIDQRMNDECELEAII